MGICKGCLTKQQKIDQLSAEVVRLTAKLKYQERNGKEKVFGSSTPSSKMLMKKNSDEEKAKRQGGAKKGHKGNGRRRVKKEEEKEIIEVPAPDKCPECGENLIGNGYRERTVKDVPVVEVKTVVYRIGRCVCPKCKKTVESNELPVLPRCLIGNQLLAHIIEQHYIHGVPLGRLESQFGINTGTMIGSLHRLGKLFEPVIEKLIREYRESEVKHADETGWRNNGKNGYAWLFLSENVSLFRLRGSRSGKVAHEVLGEEKLPGVLVVDRYNGYNKAPCAIQYCQAHLLRDVKDLGEEYPDHAEIQAFVKEASELLASAIHLRTMAISDATYLRMARQVKKRISAIMEHSAQHPGIQKIQDIYRQHKKRMYHWAKNRKVPADNNFAERELRPLVIARKVSFGSQSDAGAYTREILMSILHTMRLRKIPIQQNLKEYLDRLSSNPTLDPYSRLFPPPTQN